MRILLVTLILGFQSLSFAQSKNCIVEVAVDAVSRLTPKQVSQIENLYMVLQPGQDVPLLQGEVWNPATSDHPVNVYLVMASYMASFGYAVTVDPRNCSVENYIEVFFE